MFCTMYDFHLLCAICCNNWAQYKINANAIMFVDLECHILILMVHEYVCTKFLQDIGNCLTDCSES
jgi:hypothetical protein